MLRNIFNNTNCQAFGEFFWTNRTIEKKNVNKNKYTYRSQYRIRQRDLNQRKRTNTIVNFLCHCTLKFVQMKCYVTNEILCFLCEMIKTSSSQFVSSMDIEVPSKVLPSIISSLCSSSGSFNRSFSSLVLLVLCFLSRKKHYHGARFSTQVHNNM